MSKYNNEYVKGVLKTQGTRFVNEDGQEIILHGYGIANWENVEGFMIGSAPLPVEKFKFILFPGPGQDHNPERWTSRRFVQPADPGAMRPEIPGHLLGSLGGKPHAGGGRGPDGEDGLQLCAHCPQRQRPAL